TLAITSPPSTIGDDAVPYQGAVSLNSREKSLRQRRVPVPASKEERIPPMPSVNTRPSWTAGVDLGPGPCWLAAGLTRYGAAYAARHRILPCSGSMAESTSSPCCRVKTKILPP